MSRRSDLVVEFLDSVGIHIYDKFKVTFSFDSMDIDERKNKHQYALSFLFDENMDRPFQVMVIGYVQALLSEAFERPVSVEDQPDQPECIFDTIRFVAKKFTFKVVDRPQHQYALHIKYHRMVQMPVAEEEKEGEEEKVEEMLEFPQGEEVDYWGANPLLFAPPPAPPPAPVHAPAPVLPPVPVPSPVRRQNRRQRLTEVVQLASQQRKQTFANMMKYIVNDRHSKEDGCSGMISQPF